MKITRKQMLQTQQELIDLLPDYVDVELVDEITIRLSSYRRGGPHPNHTNIAIQANYEENFNVFANKGRKNHLCIGMGLAFQHVVKLVQQRIYHIK